MRLLNKKVALLSAVIPVISAGIVFAAPPTFDHIVVVIEENHALTQVIGSASAPYINSLAAGGSSFTNMYGITHPSQPNYLEFFSGSTQGVIDDSVPVGQPFSTANLGAALSAAGRTFGGYSDSMPSVGFTGASFTTVAGQNQYVQKHNPWMNWQSATPTGTQLPASVNMPMTSFPTDFTALPHVSVVVPDEQHDMHDGSIATGDTWLQSNLGAYATWAKTHNSLLIVTFDEDASNARNQIPTVFYGANVVTGVNSKTYTLHNILRTLEDANGATHSGSAAKVQSIVGSFTTDAANVTTSFQQGAASYAGAHDNYIDATATTTSHGTDAIGVVDGSPNQQALVRFDNLFGNGTGQIPAGATIMSAKLRILTGSVSGDLSTDNVSLFPMKTAWSDTSTWDSLVGGVSTDGTDAAATADFTLIPRTLTTYGIFDVTQTLQAWLNGTMANNGWVLKNISGTDGWRWATSEDATVANRPYLEVTYVVPEPTTLGLGLIGSMLVIRRKRTFLP